MIEASLYNMCLKKILEGRGSIKTLPRDLREKINTIRFNDLRRDRVQCEIFPDDDEGFRTNGMSWYHNRYSCQTKSETMVGYQDSDSCDVGIWMVPKIWGDRNEEYYDGLLLNLDGKICRISVQTQCDRMGMQMVVELRPSKAEIRRLQALVLPLIRPYITLRDIQRPEQYVEF